LQLFKFFYRRENKLKTKILSILALVCLLTIAIPAMVMADSPTSVVVNWGGTGVVNSTVTAGTSSVHSFNTDGGSVAGNFVVNNAGDNPYNYGVASTNSYIQGGVGNGVLTYTVNRTGSYPMYGAAGQVAQSYVLADGGTAYMATGSTMNYAAMVNGTYTKPKTPGGYNFETNATYFEAGSLISSGIGNDQAYFTSIGSGTAKINDMTNEASAYGVQLGRGAGCYTNANALFNGIGTFTVGANGGNNIQTGTINANGNGTVGSVTYQAILNYNGAASNTDYSVTVQ
jgi:hypothetical protein